MFSEFMAYPCRHLRTALCVTLISLLLPAVLQAEDWPEFRGPTGQGHSSARGLPIRWSTTESVKWKQAIPGKGWSSPAAVGNRIFLTTAVPRVTNDEPSGFALRVLCLSAADGSVSWDTLIAEQPADAPQIHGKNSHASPSPIVHGDRIYVHFGHQGTACLDLHGKVIWMNSEIKYSPVHGNGGSPAISGEHMVFSCDGGDNPFVVALNLKSGRVSWRTPRACEAAKKFAFSTPLVIDVNGRMQVISPGSHSVNSFDLTTGRELWRVRYEGYSVIPRPVFGQGLVFVSTSYDAPEVLAIRPDGEGDVTETHIAWRQKKAAPHTPSLLLQGEELYMVSDGGIASCLDASTGRQHWQQRLGGNYSASPLLAENRIYFQNETGLGTVVRAGKKFEQLATNNMNEPTLASYGVTGNDFLIRTESSLYRIGNGP